MRDCRTVAELLARGEDKSPAIGAPKRKWLTYAELRALMERTVDALNAMGIGRNDRVAIVLNNGPEMASAFLSVAAGATTMPLNPGFRADAFEYYLADLKAKALIVEAGTESPARSAAAALKVPIIELHPRSDSGAGDFTLEAPAKMLLPSGSPGLAEPEDFALLLHTSGTTSRPNIVPLCQRNITSSARQILASLQLSPSDRCLNIMPLFHIHGLMAAVSASLAAGASVVCSSGFNALRFYGWLDEVQPTWYTAVPTMHQAILGRARGHRQIIERMRLRFLRSGSAALPAPVMAELEHVMNAPVVESYGMTEASHQIASNPLPPLIRKGGSVGLPAGTEVAILGEHGHQLPHSTPGEVVIRGPNVTSGYENNPTANARAFINGWFRTGDQGMLDEQGYLRLTGRLKELINRGGEKVSPLEVDEVLMDHPAVAQVVTFALPHHHLGEEVAAAVVLREGHTLTDRELKDFAASRLPEFKVPRKIVFLPEIPKGATGKLQRIGLAAKLGLAPSESAA